MTKHPFRELAREAILMPARDDQNDTAHMGRWLIALELISSVAQPDMRIIDVGSMGDILPALREVIGVKDITITGPAVDGQGVHSELQLPPAPDGRVFSCPYDRFDVEETFPYPNSTFDLVILTEVLEHLTRDPMHTMSEINRILRSDGWIVLSTPNCSSLRSVISTLRGGHPYLWSQYSSQGHRDRHNREYTPREIEEILRHAGFRVERLITADDVYGLPGTDSRRCLKSIAKYILAAASLATGAFVSPAMRGESTFALAQKSGPVEARFPSILYANF